MAYNFVHDKEKFSNGCVKMDKIWDVFAQLPPVVQEHSKNIVYIVKNSSHAFFLSEYEKQKLSLAALIHDFGKLKIPRELLEKRGHLTIEERRVMNLHSYATYEIIYDLVPNTVGRIAANHHKNLISSDNRLTNILMVLDTYEAIRNPNRSYKNGKSHDEAISMLRTINNLDSKLVEKFEIYTRRSSHPVRRMYNERPFVTPCICCDDAIEPAILNAPEIAELKIRADYFEKHGRLMHVDECYGRLGQPRESVRYRVSSLGKCIPRQVANRHGNGCGRSK